MSKTFFISDSHFFHKNIILYAERGFKDIHVMNEHMIKAWNGVVTEADTVYFLGDFVYGRDATQEGAQEVFDRLKGKKHLIVGNHDKIAKKINGWVTKTNYMELKVDGHQTVLFHYPIREWNGSFHDVIHLYGHVHRKQPWEQGFKAWGDGKGRAFNVSAEVLDYIPREISYFVNYPAAQEPFVNSENPGHGMPV